ncbi:signal peptidase I [Nocardiopsis ansamitocini]|uniref:signal peptidase I n=1 Tax=Nocardiopsis ansamitocini TaxID=1670832 RepID=UPI00255244A3|nr:signal peptidase I [Nocardiopsis ansamitocini]
MIQRILSVLFRCVIGLLLVAALAVVFSVSILPRLTNAQALIVLSGSMEPTIPVGSVVISRPVDPAELRVNDVITFTHGSPAQTDAFDPANSPLVTHRVVQIETTPQGRVFHTQGDANDVRDDPPVTAADVHGRVWYHIPYFGYAQQAMTQGPTTLYVLAGMLFVFGIWLLSVALGDDDDEDEDDDRSEEPDPEDAPHAPRGQEAPR